MLRLEAQSSKIMISQGHSVSEGMGESKCPPSWSWTENPYLLTPSLSVPGDLFFEGGGHPE